MRRISVIATVRDAYLFTGTHLGGIISLIWVPMVLMTVMGFFSLQRYYTDFSTALASNDTAALAPSLLMMLCYLVAALLLWAIVFVAVVQLALGARTAAPLAHFAFGTLEWRMFRAFIAFIGVCLMLVTPALFLGVAALKAAGIAANPAQMGLVFYALVALAMPRFLALLPAVAVAENTPALRRAWTMSAGNFWRLLGVLLAILGPIFLLCAGVDWALHGPTLGGNEEEQMRAALTQARATLPLISGLWFLISPLLCGLIAGASVSAWRALKDEPATLDIAV